MTDVSAYIVGQINKLAEKFPLLSFIYGYDEVSKMHIIRVSPDVLFNTEEYMEAEADFNYQFSCQFPTEQVLFVSIDEFVEIATPIYSKRQSVFVDYHLVINEMIGYSCLFSQQYFSHEIPFSRLKTYFRFDDEVKIGLPQKFQKVGESMIDLGECNYSMAA